MTIEERVSFLELQVENLDEEVDFLFDETFIQNERIFSLEQETEEIEDDIVSKFVNTILPCYMSSEKWPNPRLGFAFLSEYSTY